MLESFQRKEGKGETDLREDALAAAVGVNANDANKTRFINRVARRDDLKSRCKKMNSIPLQMHMEGDVFQE